MSFSQGLSGLNASSQALDVVGNNIANSQTVGFKSGSVAFADVFAGSQVGMGVQVAGVNQNFSDGVLGAGSSALDMGIQGNGFFRMVTEAGRVFYSRNGQFQTDESGYVVNNQGMRLTGYMATGTPPATSRVHRLARSRSRPGRCRRAPLTRVLSPVTSTPVTTLSP